MGPSVILRLIGWNYIPDLVTRHLLHFIHQFMSNPPAPGTATFIRHYRYVFTTVVLGYLSYNLIEAIRTMPPNFYDILSVHPGANELELKQAFKLFARRFHPDHGGSENFFIQGRLALQTLKDPVKRFAYDRFGPDVLSWTQCTAVRECLRQGILQSSGYHIVTGCALVLWSSVQASPVAFWRYLLYFTILASEFSLVLNYPSTIWSLLFPQCVAYQHILFLHHLFLFFSVALSRVAPVLFPAPLEENWNLTQFQQTFEMMNHLSIVANKEVFAMLHSGLRSIHPPSVSTKDVLGTKVVEHPLEQVMDQLTLEMENMVIENALKPNNGPVRSAWDAAVAKGKLRRETRRGWELTRFPIFSSSMPGVDSERRLPSPSPSPPPELRQHRDSSPLLRRPKFSWPSNYVRGRSLSC